MNYFDYSIIRLASRHLSSTNLSRNPLSDGYHRGRRTGDPNCLSFQAPVAQEEPHAHNISSVY